MNWLTAVRANKTNTTPHQREGLVHAVARRLVPVGRGDWLLAGVLFAVWLLVLLTLPAYVPLQLASWLTLIALLITPGYFLTDMLTWRWQPDRLERLALALPLGIALLALPGISALVLHWTLFQLAVAWVVVSAVVMGVWLLGMLQLPLFGRLFAGRTAPAANRWAVDELLLAALLVVLFLVSLPALSQFKIDGDAYAVSTFTAEALADLPLNAREPLFGTEFGPGVRMIFNQFMTLSYLWSYFAVVGPLTLTAVASRNILAIFVLLASYMLGKAAGNGNRRLGLFTAVIQLLIYMTAPFLRDDNVSLFFFERLNADKFMVMVILVPVVLALAIRFVRSGRRDVWITAVIAAFATSTIHPLSAAMLALALAAFGGLHWLLNWRSRTAQRRMAGLALLVIAVMFLPLVQLVLSRGTEPLASSYPAGFEGWPLEEKAIPMLPFVDVRGLDLYGTVPDLAQLEASQANESANPFLIWRFDVNMNRQRLIVFDLNRYMSNPRLILEPPYLLALILLLFLLRRLRTDIAAQFVVGVTTAILVVMFVPFVTPLIGSFVMPWILWRFVWLLPYALIIALALFRLLAWLGIRSRLSAVLPDEERPFLRASGVVQPSRAALKQGAYLLFAFTAVIGLLLLPLIMRNMQTLISRPVSPYFFPTPRRIMTELISRTDAGHPAMVMADQDISVSVAAYVANAHIVAHRVPTTSEIFPADRQDDALQRLIDQDAFFDMTHLTTDAVSILNRYKTDYVIVSSGSALDLQLRAAQNWFTWVLDDQSYSLYRVVNLPDGETAVLQANAALAAGELETAAALFTEALAEHPDDALALVGLADVAQAQGRFGETVARLEQAAAVSDSPGLAFRLGQIDVERGNMARGIDALRRAARQSPAVSRFQAALGDACLLAGDEACAEAAYTAVLNNQSLPDEAARLLASGDLWRQQGRYDRAVPLYEQAVAMQPTLVNNFILETVYREAGQPDAALTLMAGLQAAHPYAPDVALEAAAMQTALGDVDAAVGQYRRVIRLQRLQMLDTTNTRLLLVQLLLDNGRLDEAADELEQLLAISPKNASAHKLQGDLLRAQGQFDEATGAYQRAFLYDPTRVELYVSLTNLLRQFGGEPDEVLTLLETAVRLNPDEPSLYLALGDQLQQAGELDEAIAAYQSALDRLTQGETAVQQRPSFPRQSRAFALLRLGQIYESLGQMETALDYFQAMAAAAPEIPWTQTLLGDAWQRRGEPEKAAALYEQAIAVDPTDINAAVNLAELLYAQGKVDQSGVYYHDALNLAVAQLAQFNTELVPESRLLIPNTSTPIFSDEAVDPASGTADEAAEPVDIVVQLSRIDENVAVLRTIVGLYQRFGQTEEGIALYQLWLAQGEADGWSGLLLAQLHKGLGDLYLVRADYEPASAAYRQAVALDQWWVEAHVGLGQALIGLGEVSAAVESLETAVSIAPGSVEARVGLADALVQLGRVDEALEILRETAVTFPGNARATMALARTLQGSTQWTAADAAFEQTLAVNPTAIDAYIGRAEIAMVQGELDRALTLLTQAAEIDAHNVSVMITLGNLAQRQRHREDALAWYRQAAAQVLVTNDVNLGLIDGLIRQGDLETALTLIERGLTLQPQEQGLRQRLAQVQLRAGEVAAAEDTLLAGATDYPSDQNAYSNLAVFYVGQGRLQDALTVYQDAAAVQPNVADIHLALSRLWLNQGDVTQAEAILRDGIALLPDEPDLLVALSELLIQQNDPEAARALLEQGIVTIGEQLPLLSALSDYYAARGDFEQANALLDLAQTNQPIEADVYLAHANLAVREERWEDAFVDFEQAIALAPNDPGYYLALGNGLAGNGRYAEAIITYDQAISIAPDFVAAYVGLADAYAAEEQWALAQATYEVGLTFAPLSGELYAEYAAYLIDREDAGGARALLDRAAQRVHSTATLVALAPLYARIDAADVGESLLLTAVVQEPGSLDVLLALGDFYVGQGDTDAAWDYYQQLLALSPGLPIGYLRLSNLANELGDRTQADLYAALVQELALIQTNP